MNDVFSLDGYLTKYEFFNGDSTYMRVLPANGELKLPAITVGLGHVMGDRRGMAKASLRPISSPQPIPRGRRKGLPKNAVNQTDDSKVEFLNMVENTLFTTIQENSHHPQWEEQTLLQHGYVSLKPLEGYGFDETVSLNIPEPGDLLQKYDFQYLIFLCSLMGNTVDSAEVLDKYAALLLRIKKDNPNMEFLSHKGIFQLGLSSEELEVALQLPHDLYEELYVNW